MTKSKHNIIKPNKNVRYHPQVLSAHFTNFFDYFQYEYDYQWKNSQINPVTQFFNNTKEELDNIVKGCASVYYAKDKQNYYAPDTPASVAQFQYRSFIQGFYYNYAVKTFDCKTDGAPNYETYKKWGGKDWQKLFIGDYY